MTDNNKEVLLKVEHLCQYFKNGPHDELKAVDDVSFEIKKGEVFGLVGESGCGKTTTGRSIIKLYNITSGNIFFKGQRISAGIRSYQLAIQKMRQDTKARIDALKKENSADSQKQIEKARQEEKEFLAEQKKQIRLARYDQKNCDKLYAERRKAEIIPEYQRVVAEKGEESPEAKKLAEELETVKKKRLVTNIQMIFQDPIASLNPRMTVREIISEGLVIQGVRDKKYIDEQVYEVLEMVGLVREHAGRYPHEFSGGQRQRIGVARSVIMKPDLIIADEPVSALDVSIQAQVINLLNELKVKLGLTIMFIAHDLSVVKYFSDRIGVMYFGKMVELAASDELFRHPLHPYTRSLLSAIPLPDPKYEKKRKRIVYNPMLDHDYSKDAPKLREVCPGHFVLCDEAEFQKYREQVKI